MSGRGRARGRARGAPQTQPVAEPARRPGEAVEGATTQAPGRGRARGRGRAAEPLPTTPAPASAVPVAASKAEPPTQQLGQMSLSAARSFPPAKGGSGSGSGGGGGRREDRRSRRDEQDYNPINTRPVDRENKQGLTGEQIDIVANYFALRTLPEWRIYQHMVEFSPDIPMIRMRRGMIREHDDVLGKTVAFDGTILYLTKRLPEESVTLTSKKVTDGSMVTITIKRTSELPPSSPQCLQMFNVIFRRILAKVGMQQIQRHYFSANESERATLAAHRLEIWPGFATSILQYEKRVMLCADVVHKVLRTETVLDVIADISRSNPPNFRDVVSKKLVGSVVMTRYNNKTYRVDDIDWDTKPTNKFKLSRGEEISYNEYYFKQYHKTLTDMNQPMLVSKPSKRESRGTTAIDRLNLVPELCTMTGLSVEMRENFNLMKDMGQHTRVAPQDRCKHLQELMNKIKHNDEVKQELDGFGLDFEGSLMTFKGRALPPEKILTFDRSSTYRMGEPDWTRSLRDAKLLSSPAIDDWLLLFTRRDAQKAQDFAKTLQRVATPMAIRMTPPMMVTLDNDRTESYVHAIRQNLTHNTKLVVTLLTTNRKDRYDAIKKVCCVENPVPSQVVVARTISKPQMLMSVCTKIAIQLNCKLGGEVWAVEIPLKNTMVVGFDTYHDSVNKGQSVGGFVASMNPSFTRYHSRCTFHQSGQELFDQLGTCMTSCLKNYEKINGVLPSKIIFYRDGVGEGQLNVVKEFEVAQINTCIKRIYEERRGAEEDPKKIPFPQVTFIVVTKRINTRLMMRSPDGSLRNPYAGTVVDHEVTKPEKFDFFLVSQSVRQGTVSPTYYNIIYESSSSLKADHIQRLTYKLTHLYYNWPGTIRVPAPCQYAHKLAFLVGQSIHKPPSLELSDRLFFL